MYDLKYFTKINSFYDDKNINDAYLDKTNNDLPVIRFKSLSKYSFLDAIYTTKIGGVSKGHLSSLNLGFSRNDSINNLKENYKRVAELLNIKNGDIVMTQQTHGNTIIEADFAYRIGSECSVKVEAVDGIICDKKGLAISATFADCVPVYLVDIKNRIISLVHSGWKGTVKGISADAVRLMKKKGSLAEDIIAVIGPSISAINYEVDSVVINMIKDKFSKEESEDILTKESPENHNSCDTSNNDKMLLDLWASVYYTLIAENISKDNIFFSGICTYDNSDLLFSHRKTNGKRGNQNAFMLLK